ncbi:hypothetical protein [Pleionea sediminis]|uniref:hypothetical protein n=1 Tax=Pleionea sediminis TaxID=2569479 RepID=UPI0013DDB95E|nr:hypothetical protein [Pleionea sediminis]
MAILIKIFLVVGFFFVVTSLSAWRIQSKSHSTVMSFERQVMWYFGGLTLLVLSLVLI